MLSAHSLLQAKLFVYLDGVLRVRACHQNDSEKTIEALFYGVFHAPKEMYHYLHGINRNAYFVIWPASSANHRPALLLA